MEVNKMINDELLDAAACEALGSHTHEESAAYAHELAAAGAPGQTLDRQMRETAAALAAASPHMKPSNELRARILHVTAPKSFRLEDYRKASREDVRYYKWGFAVAAAFLVMAGLYNINTRGSLDQANAKFAQLQKQAQQLAVDDQQRNDALNMFVNPRNGQIICLNDKGQPFGRGIVDLQNKKALLILPQEMVAAGTAPQLTLDDGSGNKVAFATSLVTGPAGAMGLVVPDNAKLPNNFAFENVVPDAANKPRAASIFH